jgi:uncharacterized membrane protein YdjX (TVP38/TMEM64 family)
MFGIILFWFTYILSAILLYHILRCIYIKQIDNNKYGRKTYKRTDDDKRLKYPLWVILLLFLIFFIPFLNLIVYVGHLCFRLICEDGDEHNPYYCKSIFTQKY